MTYCLVTGGNGYIASRLVSRLTATGRLVRTSVREAQRDDFVIPVGDISQAVDWSAALADVDVVIHCAARVHMLDIQHKVPLAAFRSVNVNGTMLLARQAASVGIRRFIFISSAKVNGERTIRGRRFTADDVPEPNDAYSISKWEAENGLRELASETGMEVVIIRPPLVYGPGVKANFRAMLHWVSRGIPLPLGAIDNRRSFVALDNLVDLLITCIDHPRAANETFLVSDDEDLSTTDMLRRLAAAMDMPSRLVPFPSWMLELGAAVLGKQAITERLCGSLQLDITKTRSLLGWYPPITVDDALRATAASFIAGQSAPLELSRSGVA